MPKILANWGPSAFSILHRCTGHARSFALQVMLWNLCLHVGWNSSYCSSCSLCMHSGLSYCKNKLEFYTILFPNDALPPVHSFPPCLISKMLKKYQKFAKFVEIPMLGPFLTPPKTHSAWGGKTQEEPCGANRKQYLYILFPVLQFWLPQTNPCLVNGSGQGCAGWKIIETQPPHLPWRRANTDICS